MTKVCLFKNRSSVCTNTITNRIYPKLGIVIAVLITLTSIFTSPYINLLAFAICLFRIVRYGSAVFSTDYCILVTVSLLFQFDGIVLFPYLCLFAAIWFACTKKIRLDAIAIILVIQLAYLLLRMESGYKNLILCFSQLMLLCEILRGQCKQTAILSIKSFIAALFASSLYAYIFRGAAQLKAVRGPEVPAYWLSSHFRFSGLFRDPNYYMALLIVALALLINLRLKGELGRPAFIAMSICFAIFGFLSYSKTFLILIIIVYIVYVFLLLGRKKFFFAFALVAVTGIVIWAALQMEDSPLQIILYRFETATNLDDLTTGRSEIYVRYLSAINESACSLIFGYGLDAAFLRKSPHNLYLEILYYLGLSGLLLFIAEFAACLRLVYTETSGVKKHSRLMIYYPLLLIGILFCSLAGMFSPSTYVMLFLALISMLI